MWPGLVSSTYDSSAFPSPPCLLLLLLLSHREGRFLPSSLGTWRGASFSSCILGFYRAPLVNCLIKSHFVQVLLTMFSDFFSCLVEKLVRRENNNILHTLFTRFVKHTQFFRPLLLSWLLLKIDELSDNHSRVSRIFDYTRHLSISPYRTI